MCGRSIDYFRQFGCECAPYCWMLKHSIWPQPRILMSFSCISHCFPASSSGFPCCSQFYHMLLEPVDGVGHSAFVVKDVTAFCDAVYKAAATGQIILTFSNIWKISSPSFIDVSRNDFCSPWAWYWDCRLLKIANVNGANTIGLAFSYRKAWR